VAGCKELDVRSELAVGTNRYGRCIQCDKARVDERSVPDEEMAAVVDVKRRLDDRVCSDAAQQLLQDAKGCSLVMGIPN
jgi:hypothetical protein